MNSDNMWGVYRLPLILVLWLLSISSAKVLNVTQDSCLRHKVCWQCAGDPCSRTLQAETVNSICVWCTDFPDVGSACVSSRQDRACYSMPKKYIEQCQDTASVQYPTNNNCNPLIANNFIVHLEQLSKDIYGKISNTSSVRSFEVWIGMCRNVNSKKVLQKCGQHAPIEVIEADSHLMTPAPVEADRCWDLGQATSVNPSLVDGDNPESGIVLNYGQTKCCSGTEKTANVSVLLKPGWCQNRTIKAVVTEGNLGMLTDCYESQRQLIIEVQTSILCERNIEWRLAAQNTTVSCNSSDRKQIRCTVGLSVRAPGRQVASSSQYCQKRLQLWIRYSNSSQVNTSIGRMNGSYSQGSCTFVVDSGDICSLSVVYSYPSALPQLLPINGRLTSIHLHTCRKQEGGIPLTLYVLPSLAGVVFIVLLALSILFKRKKVSSCSKRKEGYGSVPNGSPTSSTNAVRSDLAASGNTTLDKPQPLQLHDVPEPREFSNPSSGDASAKTAKLTSMVSC